MLWLASHVSPVLVTLKESGKSPPSSIKMVPTLPLPVIDFFAEFVRGLLNQKGLA
jgi:hypothetical protein